MMRDITLRAENIVTKPDGRLISIANMTLPVKILPNISESPILQEEVDRLTIKIVRCTEFNENDPAMVRAESGIQLGDQMKIDLERV